MQISLPNYWIIALWTPPNTSEATEKMTKQDIPTKGMRVCDRGDFNWTTIIDNWTTIFIFVGLCFRDGSWEPCSNGIWTEYKHSPQWEETKKRHQGKQQTPRWRTAHMTKKNTYRQGCRYVIAGVIGQQLSTISQQFFLYSLFIGQQLSTIDQQFFPLLLLLLLVVY